MANGGARGPKGEGTEGGEPLDAGADPQRKVRFEPIAVSAEEAAAILAELGVVDEDEPSTGGDGPSTDDDGPSTGGQPRRRWFWRRNRP